MHTVIEQSINLSRFTKHYKSQVKQQHFAAIIMWVALGICQTWPTKGMYR